MSFILREREEKRQKQRRDLKIEMIKDEARRYGASMKDPEKSEKEFIYKIRAIHSLFREDLIACQAAQDISTDLRKMPFGGALPMVSVDPETILNLL